MSLRTEYASVSVTDRWIELDNCDSLELVILREGSVLLGTRDFVLRLPQGSILVRGSRESLRVRRAEPIVSPVLLRAPCGEADDSLPADLALLPQLHDPDSELARSLPQHSEDAAVAAARTVVLRAQPACDALIERCNGRTHERRREQYLRLARARAVLAWGMDTALDVARVAEIARMSPNYFVELFRRVFGSSPHRYRIDRRMQVARHLVAQTRQPIREILDHLGLDSHSTFTRDFRRYFGMSATSLRAQSGSPRSD